MGERLTEHKEWDFGIKNDDGEIEVRRMTSDTYEPEADDSSFLSQAAPTIIRPSRAKPRKRKDLLMADIGDLQYGFRRTESGLEPLHDEKAIDVTFQAIKDAQPDLIVLGGDELDLPELSRWSPDSKDFIDTFQISLDGLHKTLARLRAENPNAKIVNLDSNHIKRIGNFLLKNAMPFFGIRPANMPNDWPVNSYPYLLRLDELEIEFDGGYPATKYQINDRLTTAHGDKSSAKGSTAAMYLPQLERSFLFHHTHRQESLTKTTELGRYVTALSFGALTRIDGAVPSFGNGIDARGNVVHRNENWQNGFGFIEYAEGDSPFSATPVLINSQDGYEARVNGKVYTPNEQ